MSSTSSSSSTTNNKNPPLVRQSVAASLRDQPLRKSAVGGVMTRQPDYEERHLEMMRYLASIKHANNNNNSSMDKSSSSAPSNLPPIYSSSSKQHQSSAYQDQALRRTHESEVQRVRSGFDGRRRFKSRSTTTGMMMANDEEDENSDNALPHESQIDPVTGLPRQNIATMNLKNHPGMQKISPWGILYQWLRGVFRSTTVLVIILGVVIVLNLRRFSVLFLGSSSSSSQKINETKSVSESESVLMAKEGGGE